MRDMVLSVFAEIAAIRIDDRRCIVKDTWLLLFVDGYNHHHIVAPCILRHPRYRRSGNSLRRLIPGTVLSRTEIRGIKDLLQTEDLYPRCTRRFDIGDMLLYHGFLDLCDAALTL